MPTDNRAGNFTAEDPKTEKVRTVPDVSFLEGLNSDTLKLVELIMTTSTGQKDILAHFKMTSST